MHGGNPGKALNLASLTQSNKNTSAEGQDKAVLGFMAADWAGQLHSQKFTGCSFALSWVKGSEVSNHDFTVIRQGAGEAEKAFQ